MFDWFRTAIKNNDKPSGVKTCNKVFHLIFFTLEKHSVEDKDHNASRRYNVKDIYNSSLASRRSTYRINMPMKVAKLILPQITNKNQETIIRIYPDKSAKAQSGNGSNYLLSLSYKKLNDMGAPNKLQAGRRACYYGERPGCCSVCCPGCKWLTSFFEVVHDIESVYPCLHKYYGLLSTTWWNT